MKLGMEAMARPKGTLDGVPGPMLLMFGGIAFLAAAGDLRFMRGANLPARYRIGRHLWRMCLGLWLATASSFLGQEEPIRVTIRHKPWVSRPSTTA